MSERSVVMYLGKINNLMFMRRHFNAPWGRNDRMPRVQRDLRSQIIYR